MTSLVLAGNTSGTLTIDAPDVAGTSVLNLPASSGTILDDASVGVCRAWVNFNGTGTVAIRASFNVSGITDNGTGDYTVNFTTAMVDANYSVTYAGGPFRVLQNGTPVAGGYRLTAAATTGTSTDYSEIMLAIFR
jgi:hypothetical protein